MWKDKLDLKVQCPSKRNRFSNYVLIPRFINNSTPASYKPTSFDKFLTTREVCGAPCSLTVWDTSGSQNFDTVRPLSYGEADVFIICFKVMIKKAIIYDIFLNLLPG